MSTKKTNYTIETLETILAEHKATNLTTEKYLNCKSIISFKCNCGNNDTKKFENLVYHGGPYCRSCMKKIKSDKLKKAWNENFTGENNDKLKKRQEKFENTCIAKYGVKSPLEHKDIQEKIRQTNIQKYGVDNPLHTESVKKKVIETNIQRYGFKSPMSSIEVKKKRIETTIQRYGVDNPMKVTEFKNKLINTNLKKYGVVHQSQCPEIQEKIKNTVFNRYGVVSTNSLPEVKEKKKQTSLKNYGVEYPTQCKEIQDKIDKNSKRLKEYKMPSGEIRKVQGFEPFALDILVKLYDEIQLKTSKADVPRIPYNVADKLHHYYPDIYIPHENKLIEVKSPWTYKCKKDNIHIKQEKCIELGYDYEIWIFDVKGNRIKIEDL